MSPPVGTSRLRGMRGVSRQRWLGGAGVLVVVVGVITASLVAGAYRPSKLQLSSGTAWLASPNGLVTLVDGPSEQVIGNIQPLGKTTATPTVIQMGTSAL